MRATNKILTLTRDCSCGEQGTEIFSLRSHAARLRQVFSSLRSHAAALRALAHARAGPSRGLRQLFSSLRSHAAALRALAHARAGPSRGLRQLFSSLRSHAAALRALAHAPAGPLRGPALGRHSHFACATVTPAAAYSRRHARRSRERPRNGRRSAAIAGGSTRNCVRHFPHQLRPGKSRMREVLPAESCNRRPGSRRPLRK